jgi:E3 ubiquitin-protein ligase RFWD2
VWRDDGASCSPRKVHVDGWRATRSSGGGSNGGSGGHTASSRRLLLTRTMPGKVSCVAWDPFLRADGVLTVGDYDGVLHQVDVGSGHHLAEVEAHSGRRVCSVHHSALRRALAVSTSDDRTARLWGGSGLREAVATITPPGPCPSPVCCAQFSSEDEHRLAVASSDRCVYLYDVRSTHAPIEVLRHHAAPVSYVAFLSGQRLVSASTDATVAVWDLHGCGGNGGSGSSRSEGGASSDDGADGNDSSCAEAAAASQPSSRAPTRVCAGHRNARNFVGLSVRPDDGLIAVGSETGDVHAYYPSWGPPLASARVCSPSASTSSPASSGGAGAAASGGSGGEFISSVCWLQPADGGGPPLLAAGTSSGCVSLLALTEV